MNIVSFSLWGERPKYVAGMIRNAELCSRVYPGWQCRVYAGRSTPRDALARLASMPHVRVIDMPEEGDWRGMFWRFLAADDPEAATVLFRDADSRLNRRERRAVDAWLASPSTVHVMRDHPHHDMPILGGMWGLRRGAIDPLGPMIARFDQDDRWQVDQEFLQAEVWPRVRDRVFSHDEYFGGRPFPTRRTGRAFVGQPFDEHDRPEIEGPTQLEREFKDVARWVLQAVGARGPRLRY